MNFLTNIHLNQNELQGAVVHKLAVEPLAADGVKGQIYFNSSTNVLKYHDGTDWVAVGTSNADGDITGVVGGTRLTVSDTDGGTGESGTVTVNLDAATVTEITDNTAKVGITSGQASEISANTLKVTYDDASEVAANTLKNSYPSADSTKMDFISVSQSVDLDTMESDIATNNAKNSYPSGDATKVGHISVTQAVDLDTIETDVAANNLKVGITTGQATQIATNDLKVGITKASLDFVMQSFDGTETLTFGDAGNDSKLVIKGDLQVEGTTTTVNSTEVTIADKNITLAEGSTSSQADGGGITIDGAGATLTYNNANDRWAMNKDLATDLVGNVTGNVTGDVTGNSDTATGLAASVNINGVAFDGTSDITITAVADAGSLSGTTLNSSVVDSSLTSFGTITSGNVDAILPAAATNSAGIVERATDTEVKAGLDTSRYVTPNHLALLRYAINIPAGTSYVATHGLGTKDVHVSVFKNSDGAEVMCDISRNSTSQVTLSFGASVSASQYRLVVTR